MSWEGGRLASTCVGSSSDASLFRCLQSLQLRTVGLHIIVNMFAPIFHFIRICIKSSAYTILIYNTIMLMIYLRSIPSMEHLSDDLLPEFLNGKHVMRHNRGIWNAIWSDMSVESTFMRYGHQAG